MDRMLAVLRGALFWFCFPSQTTRAHKTGLDASGDSNSEREQVTVNKRLSRSYVVDSTWIVLSDLQSLGLLSFSPCFFLRMEAILQYKRSCVMPKTHRNVRHHT